MTTPTNTPETDAAEFPEFDDDGNRYYSVLSSFAREKEIERDEARRQLLATQAQLAAAHEALRKIKVLLLQRDAWLPTYAFVDEALSTTAANPLLVELETLREEVHGAGGLLHHNCELEKTLTEIRAERDQFKAITYWIEENATYNGGGSGGTYSFQVMHDSESMIDAIQQTKLMKGEK